MRVNVESFLALVVLLGGATAVTAAVVTSNDDAGQEVSGAVDDDASIDEGVAASFDDPVVPMEAKPAPVAPKMSADGEPVGTFTSTILEPVPDEDPSAIPGPDVEAF